ncbi:DUF6801 domain-containing protein [Streptomyces lushanensis]|uniref:DUF6801 domain-containing protein n=1 Tax=Streptomyces lushanensis TaxID=1434255 RepID=UPI003CCB9FE3
MGVVGTGPAAANPVSLKLRYTCSVPLIHDRSGTVTIDSDVPKSAAVGRPTPKFVIRAGVPVNAADTRGLRRAGIRTIEGTVEAKVHVTAPEGSTTITVPFHVVRTNVPASGPFLVRATGTAPRRTFSRPGKVRITVGDLILRVTARGSMTVRLKVPCRLNSGQNNVMASLDITRTRTATGPASSGTTPGPGPYRAIGPALSTVPDTAASGATGRRNPGEDARTGGASQGPAAPAGSLAATGSEGITHLIPPTAGTVVLGTLAMATAFHARSRG